MTRAWPIAEDGSGSLSRQSLAAAELRVRRHALGLTQAELATRLGVRANTVARWERGELRPIHPEQVARRLSRLERAHARLSLANGRRSVTPASRAATRRTNLPAQLSSFIGREQELAEVRRLLDSTRLLCLTGAGGIGKTRLAIEAASEVAGDYPDGVWLADLAPVADGDLVARAVARALSVVERVNEPLIETLADSVGHRRLLLVLDNCEHLVVASAKAAERLLRSCPELRIVATSREPLGIGSETVWRVPSLSVPESREATTWTTTSQTDAVRLFVERARAVAPGFGLTQQNARAIAHVCQRLEGIPLALELAAARVPVLSVEQLADRVDDALHLLITGSRVASPRQQTLRATLAWSYGLLSESEQQLFARLSAFAGGVTLEAAEIVGAGDVIQREDVLELLARLVNKSLVLSELRADGAVRYRLLESWNPGILEVPPVPLPSTVARPTGDAAYSQQNQNDHCPPTPIARARWTDREVNRVVRCWGAYFRVGNSARKFQQVDNYVHERLALFVSKKAGQHGGTQSATPTNTSNDSGCTGWLEPSSGTMRRRKRRDESALDGLVGLMALATAWRPYRLGGLSRVGFRLCRRSLR